jgi:sporulation-control protein
MKKVLASVGIGNASVDTVLDSDRVQPGTTVGAAVRVDGGSADQEVERIELEVKTRYLTEEDGYQGVTVDRLHLTDGFTIEAGEQAVYETEITVPYQTPLTMGDARVWVDTDLEIAVAVDPEDEDPLQVEPTDRMRAVFDAVEELGFTFSKADCQADPYGRYVGRHFFQEFEFRPANGRYADRLDEIELVFDPSAAGLTVFLEVDEQGGMLSELSDADERTVQFTLTDADAATARRELEDAIESAL